jgi:hypothetical protein
MRVKARGTRLSGLSAKGFDEAIHAWKRHLRRDHCLRSHDEPRALPARHELTWCNFVVRRTMLSHRLLRLLCIHFCVINATVSRATMQPKPVARRKQQRRCSGNIRIRA